MRSEPMDLNDAVPAPESDAGQPSNQGCAPEGRIDAPRFRRYSKDGHRAIDGRGIVATEPFRKGAMYDKRRFAGRSPSLMHWSASRTQNSRSRDQGTNLEILRTHTVAA